jgi:tetratricopeptide (TPR) repeat protein
MENGISRYVDARLCASCHRRIWEDYHQTGMGRSFFRPLPANSVEDYTVNHEYYHPASDTHFSMISRDGQYYQRRWQTGYGGQETNAEEMKIDYVLGSGNHARSYLHRTPAGTLIELPLGWYANSGSPGGSWAMSPGSDSNHPMTRRFISYKCMFCHNGIPSIPAGHEAPDSKPVFSGELPGGIDCQRCHGPGERHVRIAGSAGAKSADIRAAIVNPARLSPDRAMEVCMQCHLETTSTRLPASLQRFDKGPFSYVPGKPLTNFLLFFDHAPGTGHDDKFEAVSSVYRLRQSRCFTESEGRLTCQTCHNPHRIPRGDKAATHYSGICRGCHAARQGSIEPIETLISSGRHPDATDCVTCHMPKRRAEDTPRMVMTDHLIRRRPPSENLLAPLTERPAELYHGEVVPYYPSPLPQTGENALYRAVAQVGLRNNIETGLPELAREVVKQKPREAQFYIVLGDAWQSTGHAREAITAYEQALRLRPGALNGLRALATALQQIGESSRAEETLKRAIQLAPSDPETWYCYGRLDFSRGRAAGAIEKVRKAIALDPSLPEKSRRLAEMFAEAGDLERAQSALADALRVDPYDEDAWDLAGRLLSQKGAFPEAAYYFERAIKLQPGSASHLFDYGLALARAGQFDKAEDRAQAALRLDPNLADAHELLGGLFETKQQLPLAASEYRKAVELRPELSRTRLRLGKVLAAQGDLSGAAEHLRLAAKGNDAVIAQQASRALQQIGVR